MIYNKDQFQVVLVDLQKAAQGEIHCVKKPLTNQLKYVSISYRWGELQETSIDTEVGYVASITSFDLDDFYRLCAAMTNEPMLGSMDYVWVDAICVDQASDERKTTIYHMSEIYEHASWILAVPDLHAAHLRLMHATVMDAIQQHRLYVYHLVHGHIDQLRTMDQDFLDEIGVPQDPRLRQLVTTYTDGFANSFLEFQIHYRPNDSARSLAHLYDVDHIPATNTLQTQVLRRRNYVSSIRALHDCNTNNCPLYDIDPLSSHKEWYREIIERNRLIRQAIHFLSDLVVDWSSRVWVISEFHLSKRKNNLKFWFNQLSGDTTAFFKFDMDDAQFKRIEKAERFYGRFRHPPVYFVFYGRLISQLNRQTFLEMMLKSKASKHEDRFYAIFPLYSEYKALLQEQAFHVHSLLAVKLKLYQIMTNEYKQMLFQLSAHGKSTWTLPTFATSVIDWPRYSFSERPLSKPIKQVTITLLHETTYYLRLKPAKWYISHNAKCIHAAAKRLLDRLLLKPSPVVDVISLERYGSVFLIGGFDENKWILGTPHDVKLTTDFGLAEHLALVPGFHVY